VDWSYFEHLMELSAADRLEEAIQESEDLLAQAENDDDRASLLAGALMFGLRLGRLSEARRTLDRMKHLDVSDLEVRLNAEFSETCLLIAEGRIEEGISVSTEMLRRHHEALQEDRFRYLYEDLQSRKGLALVALSRFVEALPILREAIGFTFERAPDEQEVRYALGLCLQETGDLEGAKREYYRVIELNLKSEHEERARYALARIYCMGGGFAQARRQLETLLQDRPGPAYAVPREYVYVQLSMACHGLGDAEGERLYSDLAKSMRERR